MNTSSLSTYLKSVVGVLFLCISFQAYSSIKPDSKYNTGNISLGDALLNVQSEGELFVRKGDYEFIDIFIVNSELNNSSTIERTSRADTLSSIVNTYRQKNPEYDFIRGVLIEFLDETTSAENETSYDTIEHFLYSYDATFNQSPTACPDLNKDDLIGLWSGEKSFPDEDKVQLWTNERKSDNTFEITFYEKDSGEVESIERGNWSIEGCILKNTIAEISDEKFIFVEKYEIKKLTNTEIEYTSFRSNNTYQMTKDLK